VFQYFASFRDGVRPAENIQSSANLTHFQFDGICHGGMMISARNFWFFLKVPELICLSRSCSIFPMKFVANSPLCWGISFPETVKCNTKDRSRCTPPGAEAMWPNSARKPLASIQSPPAKWCARAAASSFFNCSWVSSISASSFLYFSSSRSGSWISASRALGFFRLRS